MYTFAFVCLFVVGVSNFVGHACKCFNISYLRKEITSRFFSIKTDKLHIFLSLTICYNYEF